MRVGSFTERKKRFYLPETKTSKDAPLKLNPPSFYLIGSFETKAPIQYIWLRRPIYLMSILILTNSAAFFYSISVLVKTLPRLILQLRNIGASTMFACWNRFKIKLFEMKHSKNNERQLINKTNISNGPITQLQRTMNYISNDNTIAWHC